MAVNGRVPYPAVVATLALAASLLGGMWVISQTQLADIQRQLDANRALFQQLYQNNRDERLRAVAALEVHIADLENKTSARGGLLVTSAEFKQFQERVLDDVKVLREQLRVLEQSRPTTSELQATANSLRDRIDRLNNTLDDYGKRMDSLRK